MPYISLLNVISFFDNYLRQSIYYLINCLLINRITEKLDSDKKKINGCCLRLSDWIKCKLDQIKGFLPGRNVIDNGSLKNSFLDIYTLWKRVLVEFYAFKVLLVSELLNLV